MMNLPSRDQLDALNGPVLGIVVNCVALPIRSVDFSYKPGGPSTPNTIRLSSGDQMAVVSLPGDDVKRLGRPRERSNSQRSAVKLPRDTMLAANRSPLEESSTVL